MHFSCLLLIPKRHVISLILLLSILVPRDNRQFAILSILMLKKTAYKLSFFYTKTFADRETNLFNFKQNTTCLNAPFVLSTVDVEVFCSCKVKTRF